MGLATWEGMATTWTDREKLLDAFKKGCKKYSRTDAVGRYGHGETRHDDGDRIRLAFDHGDEAVVIYVFERSQVAKKHTAIERGCLDYEVTMSNMPVEVALDLLASIRRSK